MILPDFEQRDDTNDWENLAQHALDRHKLNSAQAESILCCSDDELLALLAATYRVRRHYFGKKVYLHYLKNVKSGLCPEDCGYCSQAVDSAADISRYALWNEAKLLEGAKQASESNARTYCIVASGRGPSNREVEHVAVAVKKIKQEYGLHICCCFGLLTAEQAAILKAAGVDRINHNLNTSRRFYDSICSTHSFEDRLETLKISHAAGLELCCGLIVGMGEQALDVVEVALQLREMAVDSIPVNFLNSIPGTRFEKVHDLDPRYCLKVLCLFRLTNPNTEIRIAGGREINLRSMQALGLYAANSMFVSDYLTTEGQPPEDDFQMISDLGFEIVSEHHRAIEA